MCIGLLPTAALAAGESSPFTTFQVYQNADVNPSGDEITGSIDLSQGLYIECDKDDIVMDGFCLWRCDNSAVPPADLSRYMDTPDGLYHLPCSVDFSEDYSKKVITRRSGEGLKLEYPTGSGYTPIPPGTYRFVAFILGGGIKYSPEFIVTDINGLSSTFETTFYSGIDEHGGFIPREGVTTLSNDETAYLFMSDFEPALTDTPVSRIILKRQDALQQYVLWNGGNSNGTLIDKRTEGPNIQILNGFTVGGYQGHYYFLSDLPAASYYIEAEVGDKTYTSSSMITVKEKVAGPTINTDKLPNGIVGTEYRQTLSATPDTAGSTLTWAVSQGTLPDGLTLSQNGVLSGTPTEAAAGSHTFTVQVTETVGDETLTATRELTLKVVQKLKITNETTSFALKRWQAVNIPLTANLEGVTWKITSGTLPSSLDLEDGAITGTVGSYVDSGSYQVTVQASADGQTATKAFTFQVGDPFRFELDNIDSDAIGSYVYLRAKDAEEKDVTLWCGTLTADIQSLTMMGNGYAGKTVSDARLITYASSSETVLAEHSGSLTLEDGQSLTLTGEGDNVLVKLPEITHSYGENAQIQTWFTAEYSTYKPGAIVSAETEFTLHASARWQSTI